MKMMSRLDSLQLTNLAENTSSAAKKKTKHFFCKRVCEMSSKYILNFSEQCTDCRSHQHLGVDFVLLTFFFFKPISRVDHTHYVIAHWFANVKCYPQYNIKTQLIFTFQYSLTKWLVRDPRLVLRFFFFMLCYCYLCVAMNSDLIHFHQ